MIKVAVRERPGGSLLTVKAPWGVDDSEQNDAVEMIKIHLLKKDQ